MRTLKKTLCLVLALVMVLGLGAFSVSAVEYEDEAEITAAYNDAIQLLAGLNVMQGNGDNFLPKETLDRAAAAVILTKLALGADATVPSMPTSFVDVDDSYAWAKDYIGYAQANGYIKGYNDDYFGPADKLTGAQWGIMLLRVVGYKDEYEDFSSGFELGVAKLVAETKLATGDSAFDPTKEITREEVAQFAYNALTVPEVRYTSTLGANNGELSNVYTRTYLGVAEANLAVRFGLATADTGATNYAKDSFKTAASGVAPSLANDSVYLGMVIANASNDSTLEGKTKVVPVTVTAGKVTTIGAVATPVSFKFDSGLDELGHIVTIYRQTGATNYDILSWVDESTTVTATTTVTAGSGSTAKVTAQIGTGLTAAADSVTFSDAYAAADNAGALATPILVIGTGTADGAIKAGSFGVYNGEVVSFIPAADDNTTVNLVSKVSAYTAPTESAAGSITIVGLDGTTDTTKVDIVADASSPNTKAIALQKLGSTTADIIELYDGIAAGDYVYVSKIGSNAPVVTPATIVENVTASARTTTTITAGGETYDIAVAADTLVAGDNAVLAGGAATKSLNTLFGLTAAPALTLGTTAYTLVLDPNGAFVGAYAYAEETTVTYEFYVVTAVGNGTAVDDFISTGTAQAYTYKLMSSKGETVTVKHYDTSTPGTADFAVGNMVVIADDTADGHEGYTTITATSSLPTAYTDAGYSNVAITALTDDGETTAAEILNKSTPTVATGVVANNSTAIILRTGTAAFKFYEGLSNVPGYTETAADGSGDVTGNAIVKSGFATFLYVDTTAGGGMTADSTDAAVSEILFLLTKTGEGYDETAKAAYDIYGAVVNGEKTTVNVVSGANMSGATDKLVAISSKNSSGWLKAVSSGTTVVTTGGYNTVVTLSGKAATYSAGTLNVASTGTYLVGEEVPVYIIDGTTKALTVGTVSDLVGTLTGDLYLIGNSSGIVAVYYYGTIA